MGGNDIMGSELIFSDTVHQFLQVLTLSPKNGKNMHFSAKKGHL